MGKALQKIDADVLDNLIVGRVEPFIYAFSTETYPNYLKVGDTSRGVRVRLDEWRAVFPELIQRYEHTARIDGETMFRDYAVHTFLVREKGRERLLPEMVDDPSKYSCEFFKYTSTDDIDEAIADIVKSANEKSGKYPLYSMDRQPKTYTYARTQEFEPRENQQQAIDNFKAAVAAGRDKLLLYAVMRFGKSFTSMCCATEMGARFVVIVSAKTDVEEEWKETVESHVRFAGFDDEQKYPSSGDVKRAIRENEKNDRKTISLTVNRMLTGTTVPEWDTMLFLKGTSSPQDYDQAIFRLQNQYLTKYKDESGKTIVYNMKPQTLLVDFDPTRMFVLQEKKAQYYNVNTTAKGNALLKKRLARELEISPIIVVNKGKLQQVTPTDITDAVRAYSQSRSILDDAQDIPVDFSLLSDDAMTEILRTIEPVNSKNGLQIKPTEGEGTDMDTPDNNGAGDGNDENKDNATTPQPSDKPKEIDDIGKRLAAYYARILFFAFLTESTVKSLEEVIAQVSSSDDNRRIAHNVGLTEENLRFVFDKINPFVLDKLDYKIENVNDQMRDDTMTPMMRAEVAMHRFTRLSDSEIVTPLNVADDMVGLLPDDVFSKGPVLDIAAKQGEFAIALFKRYGKEAADKIYSVCTSKPAYEFTRKVYSLLSMPVDHIFSDFTSYDLIKQDKKKNFIIPQAIKNMNFSAIIGNPPYHEVIAQKDTANGQKRSSSIFQHFQYVAETLGRYTNLIYPGGRWMHRSGKGMEQFGLSQINDSHLKLLKFFPDAKDVFLEAGVADGLSIVLKDSENSSDIFTYIYSIKGSNVVVNAEHPGDELFPMNPHSNRIVESLEKFIEKHACLHQSILSQKLFSIESDFVEKNPGLVREYNVGDDFDSVHEIKLFTNDKAGKAGRSRWYIANRKVITSGMEYLDKWKVIVSSANAGGQKRSNQIAIVDNHSAFGRSRVALKTFDTEKEAQNFFKYATSEIIRFAFLLTDESLTSLAKKVPDIIDYSDDNGIIDFTGNVDAQLYRLLDISEPDQMFIRKTLAEKSN